MKLNKIISLETALAMLESAAQLPNMKRRMDAYRRAGGVLPPEVEKARAYAEEGADKAIEDAGGDLDKAARNLVDQIAIVKAWTDTLPDPTSSGTAQEERVGETSASQMVANDYLQREDRQHQK